MIYDISDVRVVDGDTIDCFVHLSAFSLSWKGKVRFLGVYAPELRSRDAEQKRRAEYISESLEKYFEQRKDKPMVVLTQKMDSFGRLLGDVLVDGESVNDLVNSWLKASRREKFS